MSDWSHRSLVEIETLYRETPVGAVPQGSFVGETLHYLPRGPLVHLIDFLCFDALPYGIDFDSGKWWFVHPSVQAGVFSMRAGRSLWRDTDTLQMHYDQAQLPGFLRGVLYDEVKPLDADTCLGLGGIERPAGNGDHFFFLLHRR